MNSALCRIGRVLKILTCHGSPLQLSSSFSTGAVSPQRFMRCQSMLYVHELRYSTSTSAPLTLQDAFTKTIPIWCAVLNTAIQHQRQAIQPTTQSAGGDYCAERCRAGFFQQRTASPGASGQCQCKPSQQESAGIARLHRDGSSGKPDDPVENNLDFSTPLWKLSSRLSSASSELCSTAAHDPSPQPNADWDNSLHVPSWISHTERSLIEPLIAAWASDLLATCQNVLPESLLTLDKPLRPVWLSQSSLIWTNHVAPVSSMPFTPLYLVSASLPLLYHRKVTRIPRSISLHEAPGHGEEADACLDTDGTVSYVYAPSALVLWWPVGATLLLYPSCYVLGCILARMVCLHRTLTVTRSFPALDISGLGLYIHLAHPLLRF